MYLELVLLAVVLAIEHGQPLVVTLLQDEQQEHGGEFT